MREFDKGFKQFIQDCAENFNGAEGVYLGKRFVIGSGNPESDILYIGMEPSQYTYYSTIERYLDNPVPDNWIREKEQEIRYNEANGYGFPKHWGSHRISTVWYNYQLLFDYIKYGYKRYHDAKMDFEAGVFCTDLSSFPQVRHNANNPGTKANLNARKSDKYFGNRFFDRFQVIILCALDVGYIDAEEIQELFNVAETTGLRTVEGTRFRYSVYTGVVGGKKRILIHTRNLSSNTAIPKLVESMGKTVREFLREE